MPIFSSSVLIMCSFPCRSMADSALNGRGVVQTAVLNNDIQLSVYEIHKNSYPWLESVESVVTEYFRL